MFKISSKPNTKCFSYHTEAILMVQNQKMKIKLNILMKLCQNFDVEIDLWFEKKDFILAMTARKQKLI